MMLIEMITWRDAGGDEEGWKPLTDIADDNPIVQSVGWVVKETENNVTLAMDLTDDDHTNTRSRIPKGMILNRKVIDGKGNDQKDR